MGGEGTTPHEPRSGAGKWLWLIFGVSMGLSAMLWTGCDVEKNYKILSKFFDGVPNPDATGSFDSLKISRSPTFSQHQPYVEDRCTVCHPNPSEMLLTKKDSNICLQCHEPVLSEHPFMHGAVAGVGCLMCHNPHLSALAHLLREVAPGLCLQCHDMEKSVPIEEHKDLAQDCMSCHNAHGGDVPFFLVNKHGDGLEMPARLDATTENDSENDS